MNLVAMVLACAGDAGPEDTGTEPTMETGSTMETGGLTDTGTASVPTDGVELEPWLAAGTYQTWNTESAVHDSAGPHFGDVRVFVNDALAATLATGGPHVAGAAAVKELWGNGGATPLGYSVMVKVDDDSAGGQGWYWYERYDGATYADGVGVSLCFGCHSGGDDFVLTGWPLQ